MKKLLLLIAAGVLLNAVVPFIFAVVFVLTVPGVQLLFILGEVYTPKMLGNIVGAGLMAVVWYSYFRLSLRVRNTWPEEDGKEASRS